MRRRFVFRNHDGRTASSYTLKALAKRLGMSIASAHSISIGRRTCKGWYRIVTPNVKKRRKIYHQELINLETKEVVKMGLNRKQTVQQITNKSGCNLRLLLQGHYKSRGNAPSGWMDKKTYDLMQNANIQ